MKHAVKNAANRKSASPKVREELQAAACQPTMIRAPANISESPNFRAVESFSQNERGDHSDEQRHATRIERAAVIGGCKAQPDRRHQCIRRACPGDDHGQSRPPKTIVGKASLYEDRRQEETRHTEAQRHDVQASRLVVTASRVITLQLAQIDTAAKPNTAPFR